MSGPSFIKRKVDGDEVVETVGFMPMSQVHKELSSVSAAWKRVSETFHHLATEPAVTPDNVVTSKNTLRMGSHT